VCGGRFGAIWLPSHHTGGAAHWWCLRRFLPSNVMRFEVPKKGLYINVTNYKHLLVYKKLFNVNLVEKKSDCNSLLACAVANKITRVS